MRSQGSDGKFLSSTIAMPSCLSALSHTHRALKSTGTSHRRASIHKNFPTPQIPVCKVNLRNNCKVQYTSPPSPICVLSSFHPCFVVSPSCRLDCRKLLIKAPAITTAFYACLCLANPFICSTNMYGMATMSQALF